MARAVVDVRVLVQEPGLGVSIGIRLGLQKAIDNRNVVFCFDQVPFECR